MRFTRFIGIFCLLVAIASQAWAARTLVFSKTPYIEVSYDSQVQRLFVIVGGLNQTIHSFERLRSFLISSGYNVAIILQRSENSEFGGPFELMIQDFDQSLRKLQKLYGQNSLKILGHSMAFATIERWAQLNRHSPFNFRQMSILYSNAALDVSNFLKAGQSYRPISIELGDVDPKSKLELFITWGSENHRRRAIVNSRRVSLIRDFDILNQTILEDDLLERAPISTVFLMPAIEDPNIDYDLIARYKFQLELARVRVDELIIPTNPHHPHDPWTHPSDIALTSLLTKNDRRSRIALPNPLPKTRSPIDCGEITRQIPKHSRIPFRNHRHPQGH